MNEGAVVGEQQQAGGVLIEAPHALHTALQQRRGQQGKYAGMMQRLVRTFIACGFMQREINFLSILPGFSVNSEV